ncbi:MAG: sensor histidine kinase [Oligoflexales bacterium]
MKTALILALSICVGAAVSGFLLQSKWETKILKRNAELQGSLTESGIRQAWIGTLAEAVDQGSVSSGFTVEFDRSGQKILTPFFPVDSVHLDWAKFRDLKTTDKSAAEAFLRSAFSKERSWDRILAIEAFRGLTGGFPDIPVTGYEETIVSAEAHQSYQKIFSALSRGQDLTDIDSKSKFHGCFFKLSHTGTILAYIPKRADISPVVLPAFEAKIYRRGSSIGETSIDIKPGEPISDINETANAQSTVLFSLSLAALLATCLIGWQVIQTERKQVLSRISFLNQVVHELNTPLAAIKLHAQLISKTFGDSESVRAITTSIDRMTKLFNDMIEINRNESEPAITQILPESITQMLEDLKRDHPNRITLEGRIEKPIPTDIARLTLILRNLVQNAIRYGSNVKIHVVDTTPGCRFTVSDDGPGVPWKERKKIFQPFYRSTHATKKIPDGIGLGLSIAKKLAREVSADLILQNPGIPGAVFSLNLKREMLNEDSTRR